MIPGRTDMDVGLSRGLVAEFLGPALLVIFAVGTATLSFGFEFAQFAGGIIGPSILWAIFQGAPSYSRRTTGLGPTAESSSR
jgi:glycerol uptake facilitator-like aquaporin